MLNGQGRWVPGYELLRFDPDGKALIRSCRTGQAKRLAPDYWRDPVEEQALARGQR